MTIVQTYMRILRQLAPEKRLAIVLVIANLCLAAVQFVEPVLFGGIIDTLTHAETRHGRPSWHVITPMVALGSPLACFPSPPRSPWRCIQTDCRIAAALAYGGILRPYSRTADELPHRDPFGPAAEDHARRRKRHSWIWLSFFRENCASMVALSCCCQLPSSSLAAQHRAGVAGPLVWRAHAFVTRYAGRRPTSRWIRAPRGACFRRARQSGGDPILHPHRTNRGASWNH